ncbi:MAG TPA: hypothetical protein VGA61_04230 [Anaerolineae bacterium]
MTAFRNLVILILIIAAIGLLILLVRPALPAGLQGRATIPLDLVRLTPKTWTVMQDRSIQCDFDLDPVADQDWLVLYRYDNALIGGVIFASQVNRVPQQPGNQSPYRPAFLVPYKLLPDFFEEKGQGYLGESDVQVRLWPGTTAGSAGCQAQEFAIFGANGNGKFNRLSIFRWNTAAGRFDDAHFAASSHVDPGPGSAGQQPITTVTTYDGFNDRSALCRVRVYQRGGGPQPPAATLSFTENTGSYTIDFCNPTPQDAAYPEGVIVALLRRPDLPAADENPIGDGYFLDSAARSSLPADLAPLKARAGWSPYRIITVRNQGWLADLPTQGTVVAQSAASGRWWKGAEAAIVQTNIVLPDGRQQDFSWYLVSVANEQVITDTRWRVVKVTEP